MARHVKATYTHYINFYCSSYTNHFLKKFALCKVTPGWGDFTQHFCINFTKYRYISKADKEIIFTTFKTNVKHSQIHLRLITPFYIIN